MSPSALLEQAFTDAWEDALPPEPTDVVSATWGGYGDCLEAFQGLRWQQVSCDVIMSNRSCVHFFSKLALHYYLPAFMLASSRECATEWDITDYTLLAIRMLLGDRPGRAYALSAKQRQSMRMYLQFVGQHASTDETQLAVSGCINLLDQVGSDPRGDANEVR